jgi:uncharacterized sulfatase
METHLPFSAPDRFVKGFAPSVLENRAARDFMRRFNTHAARWITPRSEPFPELQARVLSEMYDAEVAYQDDLLAEFLALLDLPEHRANTMVVFVADHGEMLGEHQLMGHSFGVYQELIHVPLFVRFPGQMAGCRVSAPVSTTRLFHTVLDAIGVGAYETAYSPAVDVRSQSLVREVETPEKPQPVVFSEAYAPDFALTIVQAHRPDLIEAIGCRATRWAVYEDRYKLIHAENLWDELFSLDTDPLELRGRRDGVDAGRIEQMEAQLEVFLEKARSRRPENWKRRKANLDNEMVRQRLRDLGYIE